MCERYQRNTAFLYPDLTNCTQEERLDTLGLIADLTTIAEIANRQLQDLINGGNFSFVNCMPKVYMRCVSDDSESFRDEDNVRICVTKYNNHDYTSNYQTLAKKYKAGETNISHLVALELSSRSQKTQFSVDVNDQFNAVISASMDSLEKILISIMFDISLYRYFSLSDSLPERKKFNAIKYQYITECYTAKDQEEHYGRVLPQDKVMYLPISLPKVKKIDRCIKRESRQKAVSEMLELFSTFLAQAKSLRMKRDKKGVILESSDKLPKDISHDVERIAQERLALEKYVIVFLLDSAGNRKSLVLECKEDGTVPCWITKDCEGKAVQHIVWVEQAG